MVTLVNRAKVATATTGTGAITLGSAESGYQSFADAGVAGNEDVRYTIEDGEDWEIGTGGINGAVSQMSRTLIESSTGSLLNLSGDSIVFITAAGSDIQQPPSEGAFADGDKTKLDGIETGADVTDTANVTAAGALMDSEVTNLAAVKAFDPTDYATAAQGTLADSAVQPNDSPTFTGLTTTGNVTFGDSDKAIFGAGSDLQIYHDGSDSILLDSGTGNLKILADDLVLKTADSVKEYLKATAGGSVRIRHDESIRLETTSTGVDITGVLTTDGISTSADVTFGDSDKAIFGAGSDLQIYHDGTDSIIKESGGGDLQLWGDDIRLMSADGTETMLRGNPDAQIQLYYDNALKLATTSTGIDVTGNLTVTGTVDGRDVAADGTKLDGIEASADVTDAGNVNPLVDSHLNTGTASTGEYLSWTGSDYDWVAVQAFDTQTATTTSTTETAIATYATASYDAAKVVVTADDGTDRTVSELLITWKSTTAYATEYAIVNTGASALATYDVDVSGGNFRILATAASSTSTSYTVKAITL
jgi:hypothetical protein